LSAENIIAPMPKQPLLKTLRAERRGRVAPLFARAAGRAER
jgi:hypothetical protein